MELKSPTLKSSWGKQGVLIIPYGIEISAVDKCDVFQLVLIIPYGIEI